MRIEISEDRVVVWMRDTKTLEGLACTSYAKDGTQQKIITALEDALSQAKGELLCSNYTDSVANVGASTA